MSDMQVAEASIGLASFMTLRSGAESSMSPDISDRLDRNSLRKPEDIATATIITKKLTAMHTIAIFPLKRSLDAMKSDASTFRYFFKAARRP